ncbi:hypothetical protein O5541_02780 [Escherichia coli]|nr:hypothetical protein [Escherichia coli]
MPIKSGGITDCVEIQTPRQSVRREQVAALRQQLNDVVEAHELLARMMHWWKNQSG